MRGRFWFGGEMRAEEGFAVFCAELFAVQRPVSEGHLLFLSDARGRGHCEMVMGAESSSVEFDRFVLWW